MFSKQEKLVDSSLKKIQDSAMLPYNKSKILEYYNERTAKGVKRISNLPVFTVLFSLGLAFKEKRFDDISKLEMIAFFNNLKPKERIFPTRGGVIVRKEIFEFSEHTFWIYKNNVKTFYRWLFSKESDDAAPDAVRWIKQARSGQPRNKFKKDLLTSEEINRMIKATKNVRDKALIAILWESGLRAGELVKLKRSDLQIKQNYVEFEVSGKTGKRDVILVESKPFLEAWLMFLDENQNRIPVHLRDVVWIGFSNQGYARKEFGNDVISRDTINMKLKIIAKKAGITKRVWTHGFRHCAATRDSTKNWNEAMLQQKYGWTKNSRMPSVYVHFASQNLKKQILMENGLWKPETKEDEPLSTNLTNCMFCTEQNLSDSEFCKKCGRPLRYAQIKEMENKADHLEALQEMFKQELEKKGIDLTEITKLLVAKTTALK